jgi:hypothetical protein
MNAKRRLSKGYVDFAWAKEEPPHVLAMAAWYEYARESEALIERVNALREAKMFVSEDGDLEVIREHCHKHLAVISVQQIYILVCTQEFPSKPFSRVRRDGDMRFTFKTGRFGTDGPVALPWGTFFSLKDGAMVDSSVRYAQWHLRMGRSIHPISIPWHYTNAELTKMLGPIIKRLRPPEFPEPPRAGRKGRGKSLGGLDLLQQLVAHRLTEHNVTFDNPQWKQFHGYGSQLGFQLAAQRAAARINTITEIPFFGRAPTGNNKSIRKNLVPL